MRIKNVAVIGAGTMGSGIAQSCAMAGFQVTMQDISETAVTRGLEAIRARLERLEIKGKLSTDAMEATFARVAGTTDPQALRAADLLIEAATEDLPLKRRILTQAEDFLAAEALIATNTSSLSITQLAAGLKVPQRVIGMHFFNPVPMLPLVELIRGHQTSDATCAAAREFVSAVGKTAVDVKNSPGFVVNRVLIPMINEAICVLQEGLASASDIDAAMRLGCNHPIGPLALADLIGLDTVLAIMQVLYDAFQEPKYRPALRLKDMVAAGLLGCKSGSGFYQY